LEFHEEEKTHKNRLSYFLDFLKLITELKAYAPILKDSSRQSKGVKNMSDKNIKN